MVTIFHIFDLYDLKALIKAVLACDPEGDITAFGNISGHRVRRPDHRQWSTGKGEVIGIKLVNAPTEEFLVKTTEGLVVGSYLLDLGLEVKLMTTLEPSKDPCVPKGPREWQLDICVNPPLCRRPPVISRPATEAEHERWSRHVAQSDGANSVRRMPLGGQA
jgi:hypothetical protein